MNKGSPNGISGPLIAEGGGDACSTEDTRDNITLEEGRGITENSSFR